MSGHPTTLLDVVYADPRLPWTRTMKRMLALEPVARRYVFDSDASTSVGSMIRDNLDLMIDNIEFARAPYPTTYIEIDSLALHRAWRPDQPEIATADKRVGFLIHEGTVVVICDSPVHTCLPSMWGFRINRAQGTPLSELFKMNDVRDELTKWCYVFGGQRTEKSYKLGEISGPESLHDIKLPYPRDGKGWSFSQVASHFDVFMTVDGVDQRHAIDSAFMSGGDPVIVMAALLLLNQPGHMVVVNSTPARRGMFRGKLKSFKEHNTVTITLDQTKAIVKHLHTTDRASPLLHDVEGHWKNYNKHSGCTHHWEPIGEERTSDGGFKKYWCPRCLQRRTWAAAHVRGDATRGVATKHYEVKK